MPLESIYSVTLSPETIFYVLPFILIIFSTILICAIFLYSVRPSSNNLKFNFIKKSIFYFKSFLKRTPKPVNISQESSTNEEVLMKLNLEVARLKEKNIALEKEIEKAITEKKLLEEEKGDLSSKLEKMLKETKKISLLGLNNGDTSPHQSWVSEENKNEQLTDRSEKILINEQAAEIKRLQTIINEFKNKVQNTESSNNQNAA